MVLIVRRLLPAACLTALACAATAWIPPARAGQPDRLAIGGGYYDVVRQWRPAADIRMEYRSGWSLIPITEPFFSISPWGGLEIGTRGSVWGGGGLTLHMPLTQHLVFSPGVGIGVYGQGKGRNLGSPLEFREQVEVGWEFDDQTRLTGAISHTSNAGAAHRNGGVESAVLYYEVPLWGHTHP